MRRFPVEPLWGRRCFAAALLALFLALPAFANHHARQAARHGLDGWELAAFMLTDQHGRAFTRESLQGRWTFVLFGDSRACASQPCGAALAALAGVCQRIAPADAMKTTQILFISLAPHSDTPERLRRYLAGFDPRFVGVTGTPQELRRVADDMGGIGMQGSGYSASLLLIGPDATIRAEYLPPFDVPRLTAAYLRARRGRS